MLFPMTRFLSFLRLNTIQNNKYNFLLYLYHTFFIHSSLHGHLGGFHFLATMNNISMNMGMWISLQDNDFISIWCTPRREIAESFGKSIFNFWETSILFSIVAESITFSSTVHKGSLFSNIL